MSKPRHSPKKNTNARSDGVKLPTEFGVLCLMDALEKGTLTPDWEEFGGVGQQV